MKTNNSEIEIEETSITFIANREFLYSLAYILISSMIFGLCVAFTELILLYSNINLFCHNNSYIICILKNVTNNIIHIHINLFVISEGGTKLEIKDGNVNGLEITTSNINVGNGIIHIL